MKVLKYKKEHFDALYEIEKEAFSDFWSEKGMKDEVSLKQAHYYVRKTKEKYWDMQVSGS